MTKPSRALAECRPDAPIASSATFAVITALLGWSSVVWLRLRADSVDVYPVLFGVGFMVNVAFSAMCQIALIVGLSRLDNWVLGLVGEKHGGFLVTLRAGALASAPLVLGLLPFVGLVVGLIWSFVLRAFALEGLHRIKRRTALLVVFAPPMALGGIVAIATVLTAFQSPR